MELSKIVNSIFIPKDQPAAVHFAGNELSYYLSQITGVKCAVINKPHPNSFHLSVNPRLGQRDRFIINVQEKNIQITGCNPRSVLFGVYEFIERFCGVRFFSPEHTYETQSVAPVIPADLNVDITADFADRQIRLELNITEDMVDWAAKNRFNTISVNPWDLLSNPEIINACEQRGLKLATSGHAAYYFLKTEDYFQDHPDWFPEADGQRVATKNTGDNFCYSQPEAIAECVKNIITFCRKFPSIDSFNFWPGDGGTICQCEKCRKLPFSELYADAVRQISQKVNSKLPNIHFSQLAYNFDLTDKDCSIFHIPEREQKIPTVFAFWGQNLAIPLARNPDPSHKKAFQYISNFAARSKGLTGIFSYHSDTYMNSNMCPVFADAIIDDFKTFKSLEINKVCLLWIPYNCHENQLDMKWIAYQNASLWGRGSMYTEFDVHSYRKDYFNSVFGNEYSGQAEEFWDEFNRILSKFCALIFPFAPPRVSDAWGCGFNRKVFKWDLTTNYGQVGEQRLETFLQASKKIQSLQKQILEIQPDNKSGEFNKFIGYFNHCCQRIKGLANIFQAQYAMQEDKWKDAEKLLEQALNSSMPDEREQTQAWLAECKKQNKTN